MSNPFEYLLGGALPFLNEKKIIGTSPCSFLKGYGLIIDYFSLKFSIKNLSTDTRIELINQDVFELTVSHLDIGVLNDFELRFDALHEEFFVFKNGVQIYSRIYEDGFGSGGLINYSAPAINGIAGLFEISNIWIGSEDYTALNHNSYALISSDSHELLFTGGIEFVIQNQELVMLTNEKALKRLVQNQKTKLQKIRLISDSWLNVKNTKIIVQSYVVSDLVKSQLFHFPILPKQKQVITELNIDDLVLSAEKELIFKVPPESTTNFLIS